MPGIFFEGLLEDTKILSIGTLFRKENSSRWGINLGLSPKQKKTSLTLSSAPVLARRRIFNPSIDTPQAGYPLLFSIVNTEDWQSKTLADYLAIDKVKAEERDECCYYFLTDKGVQIFLPQFELARALFFHNAYLSRTALEPDCLKAEYDIQRLSPELVRINVLASSSFPLTLLNDYGSRRLLSWLLIDQDARASFESIGRLQKLTGYDKNGYRFWHFQFEPPKLSGVQFEVRGHLDKEQQCMFVYEVIGIRNIKADMPEVVEIHHPDFKENVRGQGTGGIRPVIENPAGYTVHDDQETSADHQPIALSAPTVVFEFAKAFEARKLADKKHQAASGKIDQEVDGTAFDLVSVEEATVSGGLSGADWDTLEDKTDDAHLFVNKFECFQAMLNELSVQHGWVIESKQLRKLPDLSRCGKHLLNNGDPRCMAVVKIASKGKSYHILEVDTSDAINLLSTQILRLKSLDKLENQLRDLETKLLKGSLRWPNSILAELCGEDGVVGVHHPKTESNDKGSLKSDSITHWATRFHARLEAMVI
jgi:hypothetical protein